MKDNNYSEGMTLIYNCYSTGIYLTAVMIITSISVVVTVIVLNLHYLGPRVSAVPGWLR